MMKRPDRRSRAARRRAPGLEPLEDRRLLAYAPGPVVTVSNGAAAGADAFRTLLAADGRLVVTWQQDLGRGTGQDVYAQWYREAGEPIGGAVRLNDATAGDQVSPRVGQGAGGEVVFAWHGPGGIEYRRYDAAGSAIGGPVALAGSAGLSPGFDLFGTTADGLSVYADGFQVRRYGLDGSQVAAMSLDPSADGWTALESDGRLRADYRNGTTMLTWSEVRPGASASTYDSRVVLGAFGPNGEETKRYILETFNGRDAGFVGSIDPSLLQSSRWISWLGSGPYSARWLKAATYSFDAAPDFLNYSFGEWPAGEQPGRMPTAVNALGQVFVHEVKQGSPDGVESFFRSWDLRYQPGPGWPKYTTPGYFYWAASAPVPTPDLAPDAIGSVEIIPTGGGEVWLAWNGPAGGLHVQRVFAAASTVTLQTPAVTVEEYDRTATVRIRRSLGDLSRPLTLHYRTLASSALPGYDFFASEGEVTFAPGQTEATITILIRDDAAPDGDKTFRVEVSDPAGTPQSTSLTATVTIRDDEPAGLRPLTFFNYGAAGLWSFNEIAGWAKLNELGPRSMVASPGGTLFLDYGGAGLWSWDAVRGWRKLNDLAPESMTYGAGDRLILDYGPAGLWTLGDFEGWTFHNPADPVKIVADDSAMLVDFGAAGVWTWNDDRGYRLISQASPEGMAFYGRSDYYFDFGPAGLWHCDAGYFFDSRTWRQISTVDPVSIAYPPDYPSGLYIDFGPAGFWRWHVLDGFDLLGSAAATRSALGPHGFDSTPAYIDFGADGLWRWTETTGTVKLSDSQAFAIAAGSGDDVVLDFGRGGVWRWSPTAGWRKLNDLSPLSIART